MSSAICLIDTSIFCELLAVPGKHSDPESHLSSLQERTTRGEQLLLPMATILETGNHIAQQGDGGQRRKAAERFTRQVRKALSGDSPFTPTGMLDAEELLTLIDQFPDRAMAGVGLGDLTIAREFEVQCDLNQGRRVYIWSKDQHLASYDRTPRL